MNNYILYYRHWTMNYFEELHIPIQSNLSLNELENKLINNTTELQKYSKSFFDVPNYLEQNCLELYTLEDWINQYKVTIT